MIALLVGCVDQRPPSQASAEPTVLQGSSSTFAAQAYFRWFNQLAVHENVNAELMVVGSGESIRRVLSGRVTFAGTDSPPSPQEMQAAPRGLLAFPVTAGAIAVAYNAPGCQLRLSRAQLSDVFLGRITNFKALGCSDQPITVLHRRDASGSTANFTAALASISRAWREGPGSGRQVAWPVGQAVASSEAMAAVLVATPGAIGYIESTYIRAPIQAAALQNRLGQFMRPDARAAAKAVASIPLNNRLLGTNPDPADGYPIVNLNWMLVPAWGLGDQLPALKTSLRYILSREGQDNAELLGYVALPPELREKALNQLGRIRR
jgi:phosphate transport system substrate-binding protein